MKRYPRSQERTEIMRSGLPPRVGTFTPQPRYGRRDAQLVIGKVISGGQTGVDRAALDVALELGIACGGWCPSGRRAEDGAIPARYPLQELQSRSYRARTKRNVVDSDGTLVLFREKLTGGSAFTAEVAQKEAKPCYQVDLAAHADPGEALGWIEQNGIDVLNVAGPRESQAPGIYSEASAYLRELFRIARQVQG